MTEHTGVTERFDVVVVGAGAAGCALAARLSEDGRRTVLLLEAGPAPRRREDFPPELLDAGTVRGASPDHPQNWAYPALLAPGRPYSIARGRILGGSTAINGAYFQRPRRGDLERWQGGPRWSAENVLRLCRRMETDLDFGATALHGGDGPMRVRRPAQTDAMTVAFTSAAAALGYAAEPDKNGEGEPGYGPVPMDAEHGVRLNAALGYILPVLGRPNLAVRGHSPVRRVLFDGRRAVGVELDGSRVAAGSRISAGEVVLCAGSVASPRLLLASGVGPRAVLDATGVEPVRDAAGVGRSFTDHPQIALAWTPRPGVIDYDAPTTMTAGLNFGDDGDLEILPMIKPMDYLLSGRRPREGAETLTMLVAVQRETSRGTVEPDALRYGYLQTAHDRERMRAAVRAAAALLHAAPLAELRTGVALDDGTLGDDEALDGWIGRTLGTSIHLCGSARFGDERDPFAVTDPEGRVHGVEGLRVADTSILPTAPSRGPAASAVLIGELVAEAMREA